MSQLLKEIRLKKGNHQIDLEGIYPVRIEHKHIVSITRKIDEMIQKTAYANILEIALKEDDLVAIYLEDEGFYAAKDEKWTNQFLHHQGWSGGDGIFTFNMEDGKDVFDQESIAKTLFVFGDTFVGTSDLVTKKRLQPHLMPNNTLAYLENEEIRFHIHWKEDGSLGNFYTIDSKFDEVGTVVYSLVNYDRKEKNMGWLSGYYPKAIELIFDLHQSILVTELKLYNYYSEEMDFLSKRGIKQFALYGSNDKHQWDFILNDQLALSTKLGCFDSFQLEHTYRYFKINVDPRIGVGNYNDSEFKEGLFGLSKIEFFHHKQRLRDIYPEVTTTLLRNQEHSWIWLQDGVVIDKNLYFIPIIINGDSSQPEGLQFKVLGAALFKTPIDNKSLKLDQTTQKMAPILLDHQGSNYLFGAALMNHTEQSGSIQPDGYIYIYGYKTTYGLRELLVARAKPETFELFDTWRYYDGKGWSSELLDAIPILEHISCEMSVSMIQKGKNKGQFIAFYTYDTNTRYVAFSVSKTPYGPFSAPQIIYKTPEQDIFKETTYTYNAKAHPHLSQSEDILVSYNTNTYSFDHNMSDYRIYRARFIRVKTL